MITATIAIVSAGGIPNMLRAAVMPMNPVIRVSQFRQRWIQPE
jgi:hypothetical protein